MASGFEPDPSGQESSARVTTGLPIALSPSSNTCVISRNASITGLYYAPTSAESVTSVIINLYKYTNDSIFKQLYQILNFSNIYVINHSF